MTLCLYWKFVKFWKKMLIRRCRCRLWNMRVNKQHKKFLILFCIIYQCLFGKDQQGNVPKHLWWVHPMNIVRGLPGKGKFHAQVQELKAYLDHFLGYFRMPLSKYFELINRIRDSHHVAKQSTNFCK